MPISKGLQVGVVFAVVALVAALGVISGCGGDDESTAGTTGPVAAGDGGDGAGAAGSPDGEGNGGDGASGGEASEGPAGTTAGSGGAEGGGSSDGGGDGVNGGSQGKSGKSGLGGGSATGRAAKKRQSKGGGGGSGEEDAPSASDSAFFEQADGICRDAEANTRENLNEYINGQGYDAIGKASEDIVKELVIPNLEEEMREITALNPPASASGAVAALFASLEKIIAAGKANPEQLILQGDVSVKSEEEAKQSGFQACGGI